VNIRHTAAVYITKRGFLKASVSIHVRMVKTGPSGRFAAAGSEAPKRMHTADTAPTIAAKSRMPLGKPCSEIKNLNAGGYARPPDRLSALT